MRFVIVGVGGTGGWLASGLAASIEFSDHIDPKLLVLVDGDNFEPKNQQRQHFMNLGNKAQVRAAEIQPMYPRTIILPDDRWVVDSIPEEKQESTKVVAAWTGDPKTSLLQEGDWVFLCVDNFKARADVVAGAAQLSNVNVFLVGNDEEYFGSIYHYRRVDGQDVTWNPLGFKDELANPPDRNPGLMSCQERAAIDGGTQFIWTNMSVAAWVGAMVNRLIFRPEESAAEPWDELMFDLATGTASTSVRRDPTPEEGEKVAAEVGVDKEAVPAS